MYPTNKWELKKRCTPTNKWGTKKRSETPFGVFVLGRRGKMGLFLYKIDEEYNQKLRKLDKRVLDSSDWKVRRPFVGILIEIKDIKYIAPLSSPKKKHLKMK